MGYPDIVKKKRDLTQTYKMMQVEESIKSQKGGNFKDQKPSIVHELKQIGGKEVLVKSSLHMTFVVARIVVES